MSQPSHPIPPETLAAGYETRDLRPRPAFIFLIFFVASLVIVHLIGVGVLSWLERDQAIENSRSFPARPLSTSAIPPGPLLEPEPGNDVLPRIDLEEVQAREQALIGPANWGWVDAGHHFARIPLQDAIDLAVANGLPSTLPATQPTPQSFMPPASALHGPGGIP